MSQNPNIPHRQHGMIFGAAKALFNLAAAPVRFAGRIISPTTDQRDPGPVDQQQQEERRLVLREAAGQHLRADASFHEINIPKAKSAQLCKFECDFLKKLEGPFDIAFFAEPYSKVWTCIGAEAYFLGNNGKGRSSYIWSAAMGTEMTPLRNCVTQRQNINDSLRTTTVAVDVASRIWPNFLSSMFEIYQLAKQHNLPLATATFDAIRLFHGHVFNFALPLFDMNNPICARLQQTLMHQIFAVEMLIWSIPRVTDFPSDEALTLSNNEKICQKKLKFYSDMVKAYNDYAAKLPKELLSADPIHICGAEMIQGIPGHTGIVRVKNSIPSAPVEIDIAPVTPTEVKNPTEVKLLTVFQVFE